MNKIVCVVSCPIQSLSGYGCHSRDIVRSLIKIKPDWDIKILAQRWGDTPLTALVPGVDDDLISRTHFQLQLNKKPEVWMQITVPNEFQANGEYNIGITAGIETTICSPEWVDGLNRMDLIITPSEFAKSTLQNTRWEQVNAQTKVVERVLKCEKPISVLFEGFDTKDFNYIETLSETEVKQTIDDIPNQFCFLFVGHWLNGEFGHDRKDVGGLIDAFIKAFKDQPDAPALVLKTSSAKFSVMDRTDMLKRINSIKSRHSGIIPPIYLLHGDLDTNELNELYNHPKIKAFVSFTKGEGFGRPLLEFGVSKKPIITTNWSGHLDFLNVDNSVLLPGKLENVHDSAAWDKVILKESQWFYVDYEYAIKKLNNVFKNYHSYKQRAEKHYNYIMKRFTLDHMTEKFSELLDGCLPKFSIQSTLVLPKLKKLDESSLGALNLPKLKKL